MSVSKACELLGGQAALAARLKVSPAFVSQLVNLTRPVPVHLAIAIERETAGAVTVEDLCPDIDWAVIRGKPAQEGLV